MTICESIKKGTFLSGVGHILSGIGQLLIGISAIIAIYKSTEILSKISELKSLSEQIKITSDKIDKQSDIILALLKEKKVDSIIHKLGKNPSPQKIRDIINQIPTMPDHKNNIYLPQDKKEQVIEEIQKMGNYDSKFILEKNLESKYQ